MVMAMESLDPLNILMGWPWGCVTARSALSKASPDSPGSISLSSRDVVITLSWFGALLLCSWAVSPIRRGG